jgi:hypothetical protein
MLAFEGAPVRDGQGFAGYGDALWRMTMLLATIDSQYWLGMVEERILCFLLSLCLASVLGCLTAVPPTFFFGQELGVRWPDRRAAALHRLASSKIARLRAEMRGAWS